MFETLESRLLMSVAADVTGDTLIVVGDAGANHILVERSGANLLVRAYDPTLGEFRQVYKVFNSGIDEIRIYGYDGADKIFVQDTVLQRAIVMGGRGADYIRAGGGTATVYGHGNWETDPTGSHRPSTDDNAADTLVTGNGPAWNQYIGGGGNDTFITRVFASIPTAPTQLTYDAMSGGNGNDTFRLVGNRKLDINAGAGNDRFAIGAQNQGGTLRGGTGQDTVDYSNIGQAVYVKPEISTASGLLNGLRNQFIANDVETIIGTPFADEMRGSGAFNNFRGMDGNDTLVGNGNNDVLDGGNGNDILTGGNANDTLIGGAGNDTLRGLGGNDVLLGNAGADSLLGGSGNDNLYGGTENDVLRGEDGNDRLYGEAGSDYLYAGFGTNVLVGGEGADYLDASNGTWFDIIRGDNANGTGGGNGWIDVALLDRIILSGVIYTDTPFGVETITYV